VFQHDLFLRRKSFQIKTQRSHIAGEFRFVLFERHEDTGFVVFDRAADQEFHGHQSLAATRVAADERGSAFGQAAAGDFIQAGNAAGDFFQRAECCRPGIRCFHH